MFNDITKCGTLLITKLRIVFRETFLLGNQPWVFLKKNVIGKYFVVIIVVFTSTNERLGCFSLMTSNRIQ